MRTTNSMCFRCDFDGGDCCKPDWYKDDYCDQRNNNEVHILTEIFMKFSVNSKHFIFQICEWDGGDCTPTGGSYSSSSNSTDID